MQNTKFKGISVLNQKIKFSATSYSVFKRIFWNKRYKSCIPVSPGTRNHTFSRRKVQRLKLLFITSCQISCAPQLGLNDYARVFLLLSLFKAYPWRHYVSKMQNLYSANKKELSLVMPLFFLFFFSKTNISVGKQRKTLYSFPKVIEFSLQGNRVLIQLRC